MLKQIFLSVLFVVSHNLFCSDLFTIAFKEGEGAVKLQNITLFLTKDSAKIQEEVFEQLKKLGFSEAASHALRGFMLYFPSKRPVLKAGPVKPSNLVITDADVKLLQHEQVKEELEHIKKILSDRTIEFSKVNFSQPLTFPAEGIETFHVQGFDGQQTLTSTKYAVKPGYRYEISKATEVNGKYFCADGEEITPFSLCVHRTPLKEVK